MLLVFVYASVVVVVVCRHQPIFSIQCAYLYLTQLITKLQFFLWSFWCCALYVSSYK